MRLGRITCQGPRPFPKSSRNRAAAGRSPINALDHGRRKEHSGAALRIMHGQPGHRRTTAAWRDSAAMAKLSWKASAVAKRTFDPMARLPKHRMTSSKSVGLIRSRGQVDELLLSKIVLDSVLLS